MKKSDLENRKENYLVKTKITRYLENGDKDNTPIENVLCKVYLPVKVTDSVFLIFHLTEEQYRIFDTDIFWNFAVESIEDLPEHYIPHDTTNISAENVYFKNLTNTHWGFGISEPQLIAEPIDLKIEHFRSPDRVDIPKTFGRFWLTPNKLISPGQSRSTSHTGEVKFDTVWSVDFTLENGLNLNFTKRHRYRNGEDNEYISWSELVANYELEGKAQGFDDVYNSLADLDDFLKISSLAVRHNCVCVGFDIVNTEGYILEFYRRNIAISPATETIPNKK